MINLREGEKRDICASVVRLRGTGSISLTTPQRRILNSTRALVTGYDWAAATWDGTASELYALFDSTAIGLTTAGTYYMQLRGTIGAELYKAEVQVVLAEVGP